MSNETPAPYQVVDGDSDDNTIAPQTAASPAWESLTKREREVAILLSEGMTNRAIAEHLFIGIKTVDTHRGHIMQKLESVGVHSNVTLVRYCLKNGYVTL